jgi:hypothetical protein
MRELANLFSGHMRALIEGQIALLSRWASLEIHTPTPAMLVVYDSLPFPKSQFKTTAIRIPWTACLPRLPHTHTFGNHWELLQSHDSLVHDGAYSASTASNQDS